AAGGGVTDGARFMGRHPAEAFVELMAVTDVGVNLRLPPTNGETSGALLNMLASGVSTIVTDVATFTVYPSNVVRKVRWEREGLAGLQAAMRELACEPSRRAALARDAQLYVQTHHDWATVGKQYVEEIERCHARKTNREWPLASLTGVHGSNHALLHAG